MIETLNALANVYFYLRNLEECEKIYRISVALTRDEFGNATLQSIPALEGIAWCYRNLARYEEAEALYKQSLSIGETYHGSDHLEVATGIRIQAYFYKDWYAGKDGNADPELQGAWIE
jgi:tetratricopeptide (TPR) repeat protein